MAAVAVVTCVCGSRVSPFNPSTRTVTVDGAAASAGGEKTAVASTSAQSRAKAPVTAHVRGNTPCETARERDVSMEPTPFHEGLWALAGGRSPGSRAYPSVPSHPAGGGTVACATSARHRRHPRARWRVRAGSPPDFPGPPPYDRGNPPPRVARRPAARRGLTPDR